MKRKLESPDNSDQPANKQLVMSSSNVGQLGDFVNNPNRWDVTFRVPLEVSLVQKDKNNDRDEKEDFALDAGDDNSDGVYTEYPCVKTFFAMRSPYFDKVFFENGLDNKVVTLQDVDCDTFEFIRDWCYNTCSTIDDSDEFEENIFNILVCAFKYDIKDLFNKSINFIRNEWIVDYKSFRQFLRQTKEFGEEALPSQYNALIQVLPMIFNNNKVIRLWSGAHMIEDLKDILSVDVLECLLKCDSLFMREEFIFELCENFVSGMSGVHELTFFCEQGDSDCGKVRGLNLFYCNDCHLHVCQDCRESVHDKCNVMKNTDRLCWLSQDVERAVQANEASVRNGNSVLPMMSAIFDLVDDGGGKYVDPEDCCFCWSHDPAFSSELSSACQDCKPDGLYLAWKYKQIMTRLVPWIRFENMEIDYFKKYVCKKMKKLKLLEMDRIGEICYKMIFSDENGENGENGEKGKGRRYEWKDNIIHFDEETASECGQDVKLNYKYNECVWVMPKSQRRWKHLKEPVHISPTGIHKLKFGKANKSVEYRDIHCRLEDVVIYKNNIGLKPHVEGRSTGPGWYEDRSSYGPMNFAPHVRVEAQSRKGDWSFASQVEVLEEKRKDMEGAAFIRVKQGGMERWICCQNKELIRKSPSQPDHNIKG